MAYARRTDGNHAAIVQVLRKTGWYVQDTSRVGNGFPDLVCWHPATGELRLVEVKALKGTPTPAQRKFHDEGWPVVTVRTIHSALNLLDR